MVDPRGVVVGVAPSEASETGAVEESVEYTATGVIVHSGMEVCRTQAFDVGDIVGVYLDMNTQKVAFFLNNEALLDPREAGESTADDGETSGIEAGALEMKSGAYAADTKQVSWYSFRSRTMFATIRVSSDADSLVVMRSELPDGYR